MELLSQNNKALLWQVLVDNRAFEHIDISLVSKVNHEFETILHGIHVYNERQPTNPPRTLTQLNQQCISKMIQYLTPLKTIDDYSASNRSSRRVDELNRKLKEYQDERINVAPVVEQIDFSTTSSIDPIKDMDSEINKLLEERSRDMPMIPPPVDMPTLPPPMETSMHASSITLDTLKRQLDMLIDMVQKQTKLIESMPK